MASHEKMTCDKESVSAPDAKVTSPRKNDLSPSADPKIQSNNIPQSTRVRPPQVILLSAGGASSMERDLATLGVRPCKWDPRKICLANAATTKYGPPGPRFFHLE